MIKLLVLLMLNSAIFASEISPLRDGKANPYSTEGLGSKRGSLLPPPVLLDPQELNRVLFSDLQEQNEDLKKVKYYLLNGETRLAQAYLAKLAFTTTKLRPVIHRYLGILSFIEGKFQKSLDYLSLKDLQSFGHYPKICSLKVLNLVVLSKTKTLEDEWEKCQLENFTHFNQGNFIWLQTLVMLKLKQERGITKIPFRNVKLVSLDINQLKIFLKLALYLNQEKLVEAQVNEMDQGQFEDEEVRELIGQILFRLGSLAKSYKFIEDLKSPNAENIKGNLYVLRGKLELAYAQFKLALEQKSNSQNAMERLLPLAWLLSDWEEGAKIAERVIASPQTQVNKMTLLSAFYAQKGDYEKAKDVLDAINTRSRRGIELDVTQIHSFVGLMQNKPEVVKKQASLSCHQYDMMNCWLNLQMNQWDSFPLTIRRSDKIPSKREWEKLSNEDINQPLKETVFINQLDIEELDDKLIKLIPNAR